MLQQEISAAATNAHAGLTCTWGWPKAQEERRRRLRIMNIVGAFPPAFAEGGPGLMAYSLCRAFQDTGHEVFVMTTDKCLDKHLDIASGETEWEGVPVRYCRWKPSQLPYHSPELRQQVRRRLTKTDVALISSSWTSYGVVSGWECRRAGVPYILYAHGSYEPARLRHRWLRKKLWWRFLDRSLYQNAASIIALTNAEVEQLRNMGVTTRIDRIPIGVDKTHLNVAVARANIWEQYPVLKNKKVVLFLWRIHELKGVAELVQSFALAAKRMGDAVLVLAGPCDQTYAQVLLDLAAASRRFGAQICDNGWSRISRWQNRNVPR